MPMMRIQRRALHVTVWTSWDHVSWKLRSHSRVWAAQRTSGQAIGMHSFKHALLNSFGRLSATKLDHARQLREDAVLKSLVGTLMVNAFSSPVTFG